MNTLTAVTDTSIASYKEVKATTEMTQCERVLCAFRYFKFATDLEIARHLNLPENRVAARRNKLVKDGKLIFVREEACKISGRNSNHYSINPFPELFVEKKLSNAEKIKQVLDLCEGKEFVSTQDVKNILG